ncbi:CTD small phosphatase-like protein 2-B isoform X2 [Rhineura floridana]|uniref:CTD small phosphatase-like protein 2-B isoform X2 n=1 Tax=Rhineura floridana TaxID=261503 RepID=UPI002AC85EB1|nr:CTD small phosphatase-like protein 2-B isoform X2 [Rhineura floridana]
MFPSSSKEPSNSEADCLPFASYSSFLTVDALESPRQKPWDDALYLGGFLHDGPVGVDAFNTLTHLKVSQKPRKKIPRKTRHTPKNTLVLDLEGTLAVSSLTALWDDASAFTTYFLDKPYQVSMKLRPHVHEFLEALAKIYEVFVFTTAKQEYADKILEGLGPQRNLIRHQLYQEDCLCCNGSYRRDLSVLERDLDRTVAVANDRQAFPYQISSVVLIPRWTGDPQDKELLGLIPVLEKLS